MKFTLELDGPSALVLDRLLAESAAASTAAAGLRWASDAERELFRLEAAVAAAAREQLLTQTPRPTRAPGQPDDELLDELSRLGESPRWCEQRPHVRGHRQDHIDEKRTG